MVHFCGSKLKMMTDHREKDKEDQKDEIKSFIEKKKTQNKALQKMMEQLQSSESEKEKINSKH